MPKNLSLVSHSEDAPASVESSALLGLSSSLVGDPELLLVWMDSFVSYVILISRPNLGTYSGASDKQQRALLNSFLGCKD